MSVSYRDILEGLTQVKTALPAGPEIKTNKRKRSNRATEVEAQVRATLLELMSASESDSVRVAAAKALMDKMLANDMEEDSARQHEEEERAAAIMDARNLLAELAERISGGAGEPVAMADDSAPAADHAADDTE